MVSVPLSGQSGGVQLGVSSVQSTIGASIPPERLLPNVQQAQSLTCFGDSHTAGYAASSAATTYVALLGAALNVTPVNYGISGTQAADQASIIYPNYTPLTTGSQMATLMIGTNDAYWYAENAYKQQAFFGFHQALTAYLATPRKHRAQTSTAITYAGTWTNSTKYGAAISKQTTVQNSTATVNLYGPVAYIAYTVANGDAGTFDVLVDGTLYGSYTTAPPSGVDIGTIALGTFGSSLIRLANLTETYHSVQVKKTSAGGTVTLDWAASAAGQNRAEGAQVVVGGIPRGVAQDNNVAVYLDLIKRSALQLAGDGLAVSYADVPGFIDASTDLIVDGTHTNDTGMGHIRDAFMAAINSNARSGLFRPGAAKTIPDALGDNVVRGSSVTLNSGTYAATVGGGDGHTVGGAFNTVVGGRFNTSSGFFCTVGGYNNFATGYNSAVFGNSATDRGQAGVDAYACGLYATAGDCQITRRVMRSNTTDATATRATTDAGVPNFQNTANIIDGSAYSIRYRVVGRQTAGASGTVGDTALFEGIVLLKRGTGVANTAFVAGSRVASTTTDAAITAGTAFAPSFGDTGTTGWRLTLAADATYGGLAVTVTGEASKTIRWVVGIEATELTP